MGSRLFRTAKASRIAGHAGNSDSVRSVLDEVDKW